jgi:hypothetical protein
MTGFAARLHLPFAQCPELDKALWREAVDTDDPFASGAGPRLSPGSAPH